MVGQQNSFAFRLNGFEFGYAIHGDLQAFHNVSLSKMMVRACCFCKSCKLLLLRMESLYISEVSEFPLRSRFVPKYSTCIDKSYGSQQ